MYLLTPVLFLAAFTVGEVLGRKLLSPTNLPVVLPNGYLADTHEVAAAKSAHFANLSHQHHGGLSSSRGDVIVAHVLHDGHIADTHEVSAAKAGHFTAVANAHAHGRFHLDGQDAEGYGQYSGAYYHGYGNPASYHGPTAKPVVLPSGYLADTQDVSAAKAVHFAAVAKAHAHGELYPSVQYATGHDHFSEANQGYETQASYHEPTAKPVVLSSGYLADTHEVTHAKQHHLHILHSSQSSHHNVY